MTTAHTAYMEGFRKTAEDHGFTAGQLMKKDLRSLDSNSRKERSQKSNAKNKLDKILTGDNLFAKMNQIKAKTIFGDNPTRKELLITALCTPNYTSYGIW